MKAVFIALFAGMVGCGSGQAAPAVGAGTFKEEVLYSFCGQQSCTDGRSPSTSLIDLKGMLYGTAGGSGFAVVNLGCCGTVISLDPNAGAEKALYAFCSMSNCADGDEPDASLIAVKGKLYGTTLLGGGTGCGGSGCGTAFSLDPTTGAEEVLYAFCGQSNCADGANPRASLIDADGTLYGTTYCGGVTGCGSSGCGTVFSIDPHTGAEMVLHVFCSESNCADGANPNAGLVDVNGSLYGTTNDGGGTGCDGGCGTVFSINPDTGVETVLYSFTGGTDGEYPSFGSLIEVNGTLYGTTYAGGSNNCSISCGTVYALDPGTGTETVLHSFLGGTDGQWPIAGLVAVKGELYGTTWFGGTYHSGTAFALDLKTSAEKVVYSFCSQTNCADGGRPEAGLVDFDGELYGTSQGGGAYCQDSSGCGTVFVLKKKR